MTTEYIYNAFGELSEERTSGSSAAIETRRTYVFADHLGSTRMVVAADPAVGPRGWWDYAPFGEEVPKSAGRTTVSYYRGVEASTHSGPMFTGPVRDRLADGGTTGLDYFGTRYFGGAQGRFTSPDPFLGSGRPEDPQSWNRYAYARNNPLAYIDPTGLDYEHLEGRQKKLIDEWAAAQNKANRTNVSAEKMYNGLADSQRSTYESVSHAMMNTAVTDASGKAVGNALDLVGS